MRKPIYTVHNGNGDPVLKLWGLFWCKWLTLYLHKIENADLKDCFHSHPAKAVRIILWGGYTEENLNVKTWAKTLKRWWPGMIGVVRPDTIHRIAKVKISWSLWFRSNIDLHDIVLYGPGWSEVKGMKVIRGPWQQ